MILLNGNSSGPAVYDAPLGRWWDYGELVRETERLGALLRPGKQLAFCFCRMDGATILMTTGSKPVGSGCG